MANEAREDRLDELLGHREELPSDAFVLNVMHEVKRARRVRGLILLLFGIVGAVFGTIGAILLSGRIAALFSTLPATATMQAVLIICAGVAFYTWFMNDDLNLPS